MSDGNYCYDNQLSSIDNHLENIEGILQANNGKLCILFKLLEDLSQSTFREIPVNKNDEFETDSDLESINKMNYNISLVLSMIQRDLDVIMKKLKSIKTVEKLDAKIE